MQPATPLVLPVRDSVSCDPPPSVLRKADLREKLIPELHSPAFSEQVCDSSPMLCAEVDGAPPRVLQGAGAPAARSPSSGPILRSPSGDCRGVEDRCVMQDVGTRSVTSPAAQPILQLPFDECLSVKDSLA